MKKTLLTILMLTMSLLSMAQVSSLMGKTVLFVYGGWKGHGHTRHITILVVVVTLVALVLPVS